MSTWALVPIKPRALCKTRLAADMAPVERVRLVRALLRHVLSTLRDVRQIDRIALVSDDRDDVSQDICLFRDSGGGLNATLESGIDRAIDGGATRILIVPGDLPLLCPLDVTMLLDGARRHGIAIAPDRHEEGTNAVCMMSSARLAMNFGADSFARHLELACGLVTKPAQVRSNELGFDLDTAADWRWLSEHRKQTMTNLLHEGPGHEGPGHDWPGVDELMQMPLDTLMEAAQRLTVEGHGRLVSYSQKVFIPLTHLCRDVCHYCTFAKAPRSLKAPYLSIEQVLDIARAGAGAGCREALFTLGDQPELRYAAARRALADMGYTTTLEYLAAAARAVFDATGLLPHLNPGVMTGADLDELRGVSASMGIMLETTSERLSQRGGPHWGSPDKLPAARLAVLAAAGQRAIPFTTGLLIGIGETRAERLDALSAIRDLHRRYGHIQEIIIQNFRAKPGTKMADAPEPSLEEHLWTIAVTRVMFGPHMTVQAPPNLQPGALSALIRAGVNDWGGVSPVTPDHVNPEAPWPHLDRLRTETLAADRELVQRLAIGPAFAQQPERWLTAELRAPVRRATDATGLAFVDDDWHAGAGNPVPVSARGWLGATGGSRRVTSLASARLVYRATRGDELSENEIVSLFRARGEELGSVLEAADRLRRETRGDTVTFVVNRNINYTNICSFKCGFCAFSKGRGSRDLRGPAYLLDLSEIARRTVEAHAAGATEVCLQGGIHPSYTGQTYLDIVAAVKEAVPQIHVHAFSPLEITHGAETLGLGLEDYLGRLRAAGLSSLPGTAAEILDDEVRELICADKIDTEQWLAVMRAAHAVGLRSTATIMYGHADHPRHWARHLLRVRNLQQDTGGFTEFVPLPFVHMEAPMWRRGMARSGPTFREAVLMHAVARLALHPWIQNIQTSWVKMGPEGAAFCLRSGANDLGGTLMNESITRAAGGVNGQELGPERIHEVAAVAGRMARQRTTFYGDLMPAAEESFAS